jgi:hypothetical protein
MTLRQQASVVNENYLGAAEPPGEIETESLIRSDLLSFEPAPKPYFALSFSA